MATYVKFQDFVEQLCKGVHQLHAAGHTVKVYLTNNTPDVANDAVKADLAGITEENGYAAADVQNDISEAAGVASMTGTDVVITATGDVGPFRYVVLYNDTPSSPADPLIAYWDYGSSITLHNGETFTIDFGSSILQLS